MSYDPRPMAQRPGRTRSSVAGEKGLGVLHIGPLRTTPLGAVLLVFCAIAVVSIFVSFFTGQLGALVFWLLVEVAALFAFVWDRQKMSKA